MPSDLSFCFLLQPSWVTLSVQCGALLPYPFQGREEGGRPEGWGGGARAKSGCGARCVVCALGPPVFPPVPHVACRPLP